MLGRNTDYFGPTRKLQRKCHVVNMGPGSVFTTHKFLLKLGTGPIGKSVEKAY